MPVDPLIDRSVALPVSVDLGATVLFSITGAMVGIRRHYDAIGVFVRALACGLGGGLLRDGLFIQEPALEMGNSPKVVKDHYFEIVGERAAGECWSIKPLPKRRPEGRCDVVNHHVVLVASRFHLRRFPMPPPLSVYHEDRKRVERNNSSHISLGNSSRPVRTTTLFFVFSVLLIAGCASERSSKKPPSDRPFFDSPDVESLH